MTKAESIIEDCLKLIEEKYGEDSREHLAYHNVEHAVDVMNAAHAIGEEIGLSRNDLELLQLAACFHDVEHGLGRGADERESAEIAASALREFEYTDLDIAKVKRMILATVVSFRDGKILQSAGSDLLSQIIADADLASFGRTFSIFWDRTVKLRLEYGNSGFRDSEEKNQFIDDQINVVQMHSYYLKETEKVFPHKLANIEAMRKLKST